MTRKLRTIVQILDPSKLIDGEPSVVTKRRFACRAGAVRWLASAIDGAGSKCPSVGYTDHIGQVTYRAAILEPSYTSYGDFRGCFQTGSCRFDTDENGGCIGVKISFHE